MDELTTETDVSDTPATSLEVAITPYAPLSTLNLVFIRLDNQASQLGKNRKLLSPVLDDKERGYQGEIPESFSSIEEARNALDHVWTAGVRILQRERFPDEPGGPTPTLKLALELVRKFTVVTLQQWSRAFDNIFRRNLQKYDDASQEGIHIVKIHRILTGIFFGMELVAEESDEMLWDNYYVEFEAMITHATAVVKLQSNPSNGLLKPAFSIDTGIILPLYFVATKSRHPVTRRKAISILKSTPRQEGVLNSQLTGKVAERLADIEEAGLGAIDCAEDVPNWARLSGVDINFDPEGPRALLQYLRHRTKKAKRDTVQEWLEW
jgi:hypothetical protein